MIWSLGVRTLYSVSYAVLDCSDCLTVCNCSCFSIVSVYSSRYSIPCWCLGLATTYLVLSFVQEFFLFCMRLCLDGDISQWDRALQMPHYNAVDMPAISLHAGNHLVQVPSFHKIFCRPPKDMQSHAPMSTFHLPPLPFILGFY